MRATGVDTGVGIALAGLVGAWLAFLLFQHGHTWDEAEHAHVAWLVSRGKRPLNDFFQHHQPLLWSLLAVYFKAGFTGARVLLWGRMLVLLSGMGVAASLLLLIRVPGSYRRRWAGWLGVIWFCGSSVVLPDLFVIRPETLSAALSIGALAVWCKPIESRRWMTVTAGAMFGAACYASPRFLLLGGLFALLGTQTRYRWLLLVSGGIAFVAVYTIGSGYPVEEVLFNLRFSSYLQSIGDQAHGRAPDVWLKFAAVCCLPLVVLILLGSAKEHRRSFMLLGYVGLVFLVCKNLAGLFGYSQAYAPAVSATAVVAAWVGAHLKPLGKAVLLSHSLAIAVVTMGLISLAPTMPAFDFFTWMRLSDELAASVPAGETVLLFTEHSPITADDASYYGSPLGDGQDRLCQAVRGFHSDYVLPACNFLTDLIVAKPFLTERTLSGALRPQDQEQVKEILGHDYRRSVLAAEWPHYMGGVVFRWQQ